MTEPIKVDHTLIKFALKELLRPTKKHVFDYLKSEISSSKHFLSSVLTASVEEVPAEKEQTIVVGLVDQPSFPRHIPGADYEYFLTANNADFKTIFRMKRSTIYKLMSVIENKKSDSTTEPDIKKKVLLTVWLLGNRETFSTAAAMFGLSVHSAYKIFHDMCCDLTVLAGKYIKWPTPAEYSQMANTFDVLYGFPGVIGIIGHCHVKITIPEETFEKTRFMNEDLQHHTILLQIVVDANMLIRDACAGFSGSTSVTEAFLFSPIHQKLQNLSDPLIGMQEHLLGSSAYPQLANLLTPFTYESNQRPISEQEEEFNRLHESASSVLDETVKLLKARLQRVNCIDVNEPELASRVVIAACVLHNFAILHGDKFVELVV